MPLLPFLYHINADPASVFTMKRYRFLSYNTRNKPAFSILLSSDIFYLYLNISIQVSQESLSRQVSALNLCIRIAYLLNSNKTHLLGNIYLNMLDYASSGVYRLWLSQNQGKNSRYLSIERNSYSCIPSCTRHCGTRRGLTSSSVILSHSGIRKWTNFDESTCNPLHCISLMMAQSAPKPVEWNMI
jgi:hypothetical protein